MSMDRKAVADFVVKGLQDLMPTLDPEGAQELEEALTGDGETAGSAEAALLLAIQGEWVPFDEAYEYHRDYPTFYSAALTVDRETKFVGLEVHRDGEMFFAETLFGELDAEEVVRWGAADWDDHAWHEVLAMYNIYAPREGFEAADDAKDVCIWQYNCPNIEGWRWDDYYFEQVEDDVAEKYNITYYYDSMWFATKADATRYIEDFLDPDDYVVTAERRQI